MAPPSKTISYSQAYNNLLTQDGQLTPTGVQAMQLFNTYTAAGLPPIAAAQIIGGQLVEDPNLAPLQLQSPTILPYQDATVAQLSSAVDQASDRGIGVGISQWTDPSRQNNLSDYLSSLDPNGSAFAASAQFTINELQTSGLLNKFNNVDASSNSDSAAAYNAQTIALTQYERPADNTVGGVNFQNRLNTGTAVYDIALGGGSDQAAALAGNPAGSSTAQPIPYLDQTLAADQVLGMPASNDSANVLSPDVAAALAAPGTAYAPIPYLDQTVTAQMTLLGGSSSAGATDGSSSGSTQGAIDSGATTTPNDVVSQDFAALQQSSSTATTTPNDVVSQDFAALQQSSNSYFTQTAATTTTYDYTTSTVYDTSSYASYTPTYDYSSYASYGGGGYYGPIVLDLAGNGVNIKQLSSSNTFFDMAGDGKQTLTAWAGAGNGVLFYDPTGTGQLTQANQIIFTKWDPSASSDMQALLDVFDTNHDGSLDAGDANFSKFYVMVTNANGTQTAESLASLGISSINLNANATNVALPDGSAIDGETTYSTTSGTTGTAATVTFATDGNGYVVATTTTTNADGSTTISNAADNADGSINQQRILNTLIQSSTSSGVTTTTTSKILTTVNNGGVVMTLQTDNTVASSNGTSTETLTNYSAGAITSTGELTSSGTTGSEKLNSTTTTTTVTSGGTVVTILRDQLGGGWTTQQEIDTTTSATGPTSYVVSDLNPDGSVYNVTSSTVTNGGLTRTVINLVDGNSAMSTTSVDATVVSSGGTRTETATDSAGTTITSLVQTVTSTTSNSVTRTTTSDLTDGVTLDRTSVAQTVTSSGGSTTTQTDSSANGTLLDRTVTTDTPQSSGGLVTSAVTSELDNGAFIVAGSQVTTISNAGGTKTATVVNASANGTVQSESITSSTLGSAARTVTIYDNGDGKISQYETVAVSSGTTVDTLENLNGDGSLKGETVITTSGGGLAKTIQADLSGAGTVAAPVFDHITTYNTAISSGTSTETVTDYGASTSYEIDQSQTVVTSGGLETIVSSAFTSGSLASSGTWDQVTADLITINSGGSLTETVTVTDGAGHTLKTVQKNTSANRQNVTTTTTLGTTSLVKTVGTVTTQNNGTVQDQVVNFDQRGDVLGATVTTTTADGLVKTIQHDIQGQSAVVYASSGLAFDTTTTDTTVINSDGSRTETVNVSSRNGTLLSTTATTTTANHLSTTSIVNPYATAHFAIETTDVTTLNGDGSGTKTVADYSYNQALIDKTQTIVDAKGLSKTVLHDFNGDGVVDQSSTDVTTINADGSQTEVVTDYTGGTNGIVRDVTTMQSGIIVAGAGLKSVTTRQSFGSVPTYQVETILPSANGSVSDTTDYYASSVGPLLLMTTLTTSANGLTSTNAVAVNGDTTTDFSTTDAVTLNADGSRTATVSISNRAGLLDETVTITSGNGLSKTTEVDANGALNGSGAAIFNQVTTDNVALNRTDGSRTETVTTSGANGTATTKSVTTVSADQQTTTVNRYLGQTGSITSLDQTETIQTQANGSVVDTITSYNSATALLGTITRTTSGNGLSIQTVYRNATGAVVDTQSTTKTYDSNGDGGYLVDAEDSDVVTGSATLGSSVRTQVSGNGQTKSTTITLTGTLASQIAASASVTTQDVTTIDDSGNTTETRTDTLGSAATPTDTTTVITSASGLTTTSSTALGSAAPYIVETKTTNLDGSTSDQTTYYDPSALSFITAQDTVTTSFDGRTIAATTYSDFDGSQYNVVTDTFVENADNSTTETRSGSGSFGAMAFTQIVNTATNADASKTTTTLNYDPTNLLIGQTVASVSGNGLAKSFVYDTTGQELLASMKTAASNILTGASLPSSLLLTDIIASDIITLNVDGSKSEVVKSAYGNSFSNLRSQSVTTTSANGLVTVTRTDNNGNGIFNQVETTTVAPDGSKTVVCAYYGDTAASANTLQGSNTYTVSANRLITTLATSTGVTDTTVNFANANGSYQWSRVVAANSPAVTNAATPHNESASHIIDANGIDTWTLNDGYNQKQTITIDLASEKRDIAIANEIYQTLLGRTMDDAETQGLLNFINDGTLDRYSLASGIIQTAGYLANYAIPGPSAGTYYYYGFDVTAAFENAFGRPPTAEEMATFGQYMHDSAPNSQELVNLAVAVAQYATDQGAKNNRTSVDPNQDLITTAPQWISPAANEVAITTAGTYAYSGQWLEDGNRVAGIGGVALTINGSNNSILALDGSNLTLSGYNNSVDIPGITATVNASNTAITIEDCGIGTVSGNNNQIAQVGPTELILSSGTGNEIYVGAGSLLSGFVYTYPYPVTEASDATITIGPSVGTFDNAAEVFGDNDTVIVDNGAYVSVVGNNDTIDVIGTGTAFVYGSVSGSDVSDGGVIEVLSGSTATNTTVSSGGVLALFGGASASGITVSSGGTLEIGAGYAQTGFTVGSGAVMQVDSGGSATGSFVAGGGTLVLFAGETDTGTTYAAGSFEEIVGGYALGTYTTSNGVTLEVGSGATVTSAAVTAGNAVDVFAGGAVSTVTVSSGGSLTDYGSVYGANVASGAAVTVGSGGMLDVMAGQTAQGVTVLSGGVLAVGSAGNAIGTVVSNGGILELLGGAVATGTVLATGAILDVGSGFTETNYNVGNGMILAVEAGGAAVGTTVQSGGTLELVGGTWANTTVNAGGTLYVGTGASLSNYVVSSGVTLEVVAGATASNITVNSGGQLAIYGGMVNGVVTSGGSVIVDNGGALAASSGQTVSGLTVSSGGALTVSAGATAGNIMVESGGQLTNFGITSGAVVLSGGSAVVSGGTLSVLSGQTAWTVSVASAATLVVSSGGTVNDASVASGGHLVVDGTVLGATISSGGAVVLSGGLLDLNGQAANGVTVSSGGALIVDFSGSASNVTVSSGGSLSIYGYNSNVVGATIASGGTAVVSGFAQFGVLSGQTVNGVTVAADGLLYLYSGGQASGTVVSSGGTLEVFAGGAASATTVLNGGTYEVGSGLTQSGYVVSSGTILEVASGGIVSGTTVSSGGTLELLGGATANGATYASGSFLEIAAGYALSSYVTSASVTLEVGPGATVSGATINGGTTLDVFYGGVLNNATVNSGGNLVIDGTVNGATVAAGGSVTVGAWGNLNVSSGQTIRGASVTSGGSLAISSGAVASGTVVGNGGQIIINGTASSSTINSGGSEIVNSGGVLTGAVINGGALEVVSGGSANGVTFSSGGTLKLDSSVSFGGTISGFALPDHLDLADINFGSGTTLSFAEASNNQSGTLTVSDGVHTTHLTLAGQYTTSRFTMAADGQGGSLISDPPASQTPAPDKFNALAGTHDGSRLPGGDVFGELQRLYGLTDDRGISFRDSTNHGSHDWGKFAGSDTTPPVNTADSAGTEAQLSRLIGAMASFSASGAAIDSMALAQSGHDERIPGQVAASWHG
jgi:autotransporter passenger strand-loop-strand repeat protein